MLFYVGGQGGASLVGGEMENHDLKDAGVVQCRQCRYVRQSEGPNLGSWLSLCRGWCGGAGGSADGVADHGAREVQRAEAGLWIL